MLLIQQRYNFESNSQRYKSADRPKSWCCLYSKDTISKAIHNQLRYVWISYSVLLIQQRYNFESNSQPLYMNGLSTSRCCLYSKDTISKAIHNNTLNSIIDHLGVAYTAKIQFRKQFTT